jgi:general secretion pathway protein H
MNYRSDNKAINRRTNRGRPSGFTLLELLVVITVLAFVAGITTANYQRGTPGALLDSEARKLVSLMRYLRVRAMSEGVIVVLESDDAIGGYRTEPDEKEFPLPQDMSITCDSGSEITGVNPGGIYFYPDGSSSGGECQLSSTAGARKATVSWLTGGVELARAELAKTEP